MTYLDLSQYDLPTLNADCMKAAGVEGAILGVFSNGNPPEEMADATEKLIAAGVPVVGFYGLIYFGSPSGAYRDTKWAIMLAKRFGLDRVWLDCEIDAKAIGFTDAVTPTQDSRVAEIRNCVNLVEAAGLKAGIYSGAWWWPSQTGDYHGFSDLPLWHAAYIDYLATPSEIRHVNYGGWGDVAIHQWTSTLPVCGRNRDANHVWDTSVIGGGEDALKLTELQTENLLLRVFAGSEFEGVETRQQRLERAMRELDACDITQSVNDTAASAMAVAQTALQSGGAGGGLTDHKHHNDTPNSTGGVIKQGG